MAGGRDANAALEILLDEPGLVPAFQALLHREQPLPVATEAAHLMAALCSDLQARDKARSGHSSTVWYMQRDTMHGTVLRISQFAMLHCKFAVWLVFHPKIHSCLLRHTAPAAKVPSSKVWDTVLLKSGPYNIKDGFVDALKQSSSHALEACMVFMAWLLA